LRRQKLRLSARSANPRKKNAKHCMDGLGSVKVIITGHVQGVMFRDFTCQKALSLGITGWVRNMADGREHIQVNMLILK
jgi:hypothetical protein